MKLCEYKGFDATVSPMVLGWSQVQKVGEILGIPKYTGSGEKMNEYRKSVVNAQRKDS